MRAAERRPQAHCLACGFPLPGGSPGPCPECGVQADEVLAAAALARLDAPVLRTLRQAIGRGAPIGWWCLLPPAAQPRARLQLVLGLIAAALAMGTFLAVGGHVVAEIPTERFFATERTGPAARQWETVAVLPLSGCVRADWPWRSLDPRVLEARSFDLAREGVRETRLAPFDWSPRFQVQLSWITAGLVLGCLVLRFAALPLLVRLFGDLRRPEDRAAFAVAADATVGSAAVASTLLVVTVAGGGFLLAAFLLPDAVAVPLAMVLPLAVATVLATAVPLLVAREIWSERARRVFRRPWLAAVLSFLGYALALALTMAIIGAVFAVARSAML